MKQIFVSLFSLIAFIGITSCDQDESSLIEEPQVEVQAIQSLQEEFDFTQVSILVDYALLNQAAGLTLQANYAKIRSDFPDANLMDAKTFFKMISANQNQGKSFGTDLQTSSVSNAVKVYLVNYDTKVFGASLTNNQITANVAEYTNGLASSGLSEGDKSIVRQLNADVNYALSTNPNKNGWGCAAGLALVIAGAADLNPLVIIAGANLIDKYC